MSNQQYFTVWLRLKIAGPDDVAYLTEQLANSDTLVGLGRRGFVAIAFLRKADTSEAAVDAAVQEVRALPWTGELTASIQEPLAITPAEREAFAAAEEAARCSKCGRMIFCGAQGLCKEPECPLQRRIH